MKTLVDTLAEQARILLHQEFHLEEPTDWVSRLAHQKDWRAANEEFLRRERAAGRNEMEHLMAALRIQAPVSPKRAADLVSAAIALMVAPEDAEEPVQRLTEDSVKVRICNCSTSRRLERTHGRGVTACGSWHRRQGWYEAMGISAEDSVLAETIWGDEACEAIIDFRPAEQ
jgi:hypothetical protein